MHPVVNEKGVILGFKVMCVPDESCVGHGVAYLVCIPINVACTSFASSFVLLTVVIIPVQNVRPYKSGVWV